MFSRYRGVPTKKGTNSKMVYRSTIYPTIPLKDDDLYVATETGDRLDTLANDFYKDSSLWWIIAAANNVHDAVFAFEDGTILRIPIDYANILSQLNNEL
jgi:hypothetical protein